jgi:hypothetical protein
LDSTSVHERRIVWAFWIACGLTAVGAIVPFVLGGTSSRMNGVVLPYALGAIALGACAVLHRRGRLTITALYFLASLAIVYGMLAMIAVPVRLAVVGTCPPEPVRCALGLERPLTSAEDTAMSFAIGMGIVAILTAFFGLVVLYRQTAIGPLTPRARRIDAVAPTATEAAPTPAAPPSTPVVAEREPVIPRPEPELELPPPAEELELPAPAEALELPAPAAEAATHENDGSAASPARRNPRRRRASRTTPDSPPPPNIDP